MEAVLEVAALTDEAPLLKAEDLQRQKSAIWRRTSGRRRRGLAAEDEARWEGRRMAKRKDKEAERVQEDIQDIVDGLDPGVQMRWFGYKPVSSSSRKDQYSPISSPNKTHKTTKDKPAKKKTKADENHAIEDGFESDSSIEFIPTKPASKRKRSAVADAIDDCDDDDDSVEMSFYVYVETPPPPSLNVRKPSAKPPPTKTTELGPYKFNSSIHFSDFLLIIATGCHAKISNLPIASMKWKFDRPGNATRKGLTNETAYDVMIKSLMDRKKDYVFSVYMLPPTLVKKELPWIKDENDAPAPDFEYNLNDAAPSAVKSIRDQIVAIDTASNDDLNELLEHYPIDNNPLFPGKRIFHNEAGYFDLNDIRLRVWAVAKAKGDATINKPPASSHFFKNQTIKPLCPSGLPAPPVPAENAQNPLLQMLLGQPSALQQLINPYQLTFPHPNPYGQPLPYGYPQSPNLPTPHHHGLPPAAHPYAPESSPIELPREISLEEYFERYKLNAEDRRVLS
ncbi:hypothetical protein B0H19DRAFT_1055627 [Mycena capillaripes]|nr:hypothetical protein B0H19DRAFT_1055627 [Mycena capillaripes]